MQSEVHFCRLFLLHLFPQYWRDLFAENSEIVSRPFVVVLPRCGVPQVTDCANGNGATARITYPDWPMEASILR